MIINWDYASIDIASSVFEKSPFFPREQLKDNLALHLISVGAHVVDAAEDRMSKPKKNSMAARDINTYSRKEKGTSTPSLECRPPFGANGKATNRLTVSN